MGCSTSVRRGLLLIVVVIVVAVVARAVFARPKTDYPGSDFNRGRNAAWLSVDWVYLPRAEKDVRAMADELKLRQIAYAYIYTSYLRVDGEFNKTFDYAEPFVRAVRQAQPELKVLAWIGLPLKALAENGILLSDPAVRHKITAFCARMVNEIGFDGIHLDAEPVANGDERFLTLLDETRVALGSGPMLSIATRHIWPLAPEAQWPLVGDIAWLAPYYREVAARADQVVLMTYDSTMPMADLYRAWTRFQVIALSRSLADARAEVLIGIPASEEQTLTHDPQAENVVNGLQGVIDGLNDAEAEPEVVIGVSVYPHWETGVDEWSTYESLWLGH
jgi:hypothetical protein